MVTVGWEDWWPWSGQLIIHCIMSLLRPCLRSSLRNNNDKLPHQSIKTTKSVLQTHSTSLKFKFENTRDVERRERCEDNLRTHAAHSLISVLHQIISDDFVAGAKTEHNVYFCILLPHHWPYSPKNNTNWSNAFLFRDEIFCYRGSTSSPLNISYKTKPNISRHVHVDQLTRACQMTSSISRFLWING